MKKIFIALLMLMFCVSSAYAYNVVTFDTAGSHTWRVPEGVGKIYVTAAGAGGGGGGGGLNANEITNIRTKLVRSGAGGGGGAAVMKKPFVVVPGSLLQITCGKGGNGGLPGSLTTIGQEGTNGGATSIASLLTLPGGDGAKMIYDSRWPYSTTPSLGALPGGPGGQRGEKGMYARGGENYEVSGSGGATLLGFGGRPGWHARPDGDAGYYGGGGGGGGANAYDSTVGNCFGKGGNGGDGVVIIEW